MFKQGIYYIYAQRSTESEPTQITSSALGKSKQFGEYLHRTTDIDTKGLQGPSQHPGSSGHLPSLEAQPSTLAPPPPFVWALRVVPRGWSLDQPILGLHRRLPHSRAEQRLCSSVRVGAGSGKQLGSFPVNFQGIGFLRHVPWMSLLKLGRPFFNHRQSKSSILPATFLRR